MGVVIPTESIWNLEFGAVSGLFASETATVNSLAAVAYLCMVLSSAFESANLTFDRIHLSTAYFMPDTTLNLGNPK